MHDRSNPIRRRTEDVPVGTSPPAQASRTAWSVQLDEPADLPLRRLFGARASDPAGEAT